MTDFRIGTWAGDDKKKKEKELTTFKLVLLPTANS